MTTAANITEEESHPYGNTCRVEVVHTRDLEPGDLIWWGQGWARVRDTKFESQLQGHSLMEDQCLVLWRDLPDATTCENQGYTAHGDVILRVQEIPHNVED